MVRNVGGMSLIELMVTVAILVLLVLVGLPFTSSWVYSARVNDAKSRLLEGYSLAKSLALRNPASVVGADVAAGVRLDGLMLYVCSGSPNATTCGNGGSAVTWQSTFPANTVISFAGATSSVQTLDVANTGLPLSTATFTVTNRSESDSGTLF